MARNKAIFLAVLVWAAVLVAGCAGHLPQLRPVSALEEEQGRQLLEKLRRHRPPEALDVDLDLSWEGYGQTKKITAELQAARSGAFRLTVPDPLGRPLVLLVCRSSRFTLIDTRRHHVYTGPVRNHLVANYVPAPISLPLVYSLLVDEVPARRPERLYGNDGDQQGFWFVFSMGNDWRRMILVDPGQPLPLRQLLVSPDNLIALDLRYSGTLNPAGKCLLPGHVLISGDKFSGSVGIDFQRYYPQSQLAPGIFDLRIPPSFTVEEIPK